MAGQIGGESVIIKNPLSEGSENRFVLDKTSTDFKGPFQYYVMQKEVGV